MMQKEEYGRGASREPRPRKGATRRYRRGRIDILLAGFALLLVLIGLAFVFSSSTYVSAASAKGDALQEFRSQAVWAGVGLVGMVVALLVDYRVLRNTKLVMTLMLGTMALLLLVLVLPKLSLPANFPIRSPYLNGARRWLNIYVGGRQVFSLQPSEIAKFSMILYLAVRLANRQKQIADFKMTMLPCLAVSGVFFVLIYLQPNLSTAGTVMILTIIMLFVAGVPVRQLAASVVAMVILAFAAIMSSGYRAKRLASFLDPWSMVGDESYQLIQGYYALANGGFSGTGFGMSRQKMQFLPYAYSDFIFAIVGEEAGFIGAVGVLAVFFLLIWRGIRVAIRCPDRFGSLFAAGLTAHIAVQVIINVMVVTGLFPTTGLPLPFFTAGGTSLAIFMTEIGFLLSISRLEKKEAGPQIRGADPPLPRRRK